MTNAVIETLMTRRSVRAFQEKAIPTDQLQAILDSFGIPKNHVVYGMAALGYPAQEPKKNVEKIGEVAIVE